jgi:hypothetical protein
MDKKLSRPITKMETTAAISNAILPGDWLLDSNMLQCTKSDFEFVTHPFYCGYTINPQFLTDFSDVDIYRPVSNNDLAAPNPVQDFVSEEYPARF